MLTSGGAEAESLVQTEPVGSPGTQPSGHSNTSDEHWGLEKPSPSLAALVQGLHLPTPPPHASPWAGLGSREQFREEPPQVSVSPQTLSQHRGNRKKETNTPPLPAARSNHSITLFREEITLRISTRPSDFLSRPSDTPLEPAPSAILHRGTCSWLSCPLKCVARIPNSRAVPTLGPTPSERRLTSRLDSG